MIPSLLFLSSVAVAAAASASGTAASESTADPIALCQDARTHRAGPAAGAARRLGDLPPGRLELTVYRRVNGCMVPVIVRENVGAQPGR